MRLIAALLALAVWPATASAAGLSVSSNLDCAGNGLLTAEGTADESISRVEAKLEDGRRLPLARDGQHLLLQVPSRAGVLYFAAYDGNGRKLGVLRPTPVRPCGSQKAIEPGLLDGSLQRALDASRARWAKAKLRTYRFGLAFTSCQVCSDPQTRTSIVRRGKPVRQPREFRRLATVERMHNLLQRLIDGRVSVLRVTYTARGVPRRIFVNPSSQVSDLQYGYSISRFRAG
jgi:hypothetical protein